MQLLLLMVFLPVVLTDTAVLGALSKMVVCPAPAPLVCPPTLPCQETAHAHAGATEDKNTVRQSIALELYPARSLRDTSHHEYAATCLQGCHARWLE